MLKRVLERRLSISLPGRYGSTYATFPRAILAFRVTRSLLAGNVHFTMEYVTPMVPGLFIGLAGVPFPSEPRLSL